MRAFIIYTFKMQTVEIKKKYIEYGYMGIFVGTILLIVLINTSTVLPYNLVVIDNADPNSMYPTYTQSDIFIIKNNGPESFELGDVIVYTNPYGTNVIHRVIDIMIIEEEYFFRVKGDNPVSNFVPDDPSGDTLISYSSVMGKVISRVPQIGHFSLAIQGNDAIRVVAYLLAILLAIVILVWPEDKKEDEEEKIDVGLKAIKNFISGKFFKPINQFLTSMDRRKRAGLFATAVVLLLMLLSPLFVTGFLSTDAPQDETGVYDVTFADAIIFNDTIKGKNYSFAFIQANIKMYDGGSSFEKLTRLEMRVYLDKNNADTLISQTVWKTLRDIKGSFMIGGSIVIHDVDIPPDGTLLFVVIEYEVDKLFSSSSGIYESSFTYEFVHPSY